jgi:DNA polymerase III subunit epsilon
MSGKIFAVIDIETTGGLANRDKITEIAIVLFDGDRIIDQWDTLINPERSIPPEITRITGITNQMVADAPKFYEVASKVVEMTEGTVFVAHNVRFDYSFIKEEFRQLGYTFTKKQLCTVRLTRKAFPGLSSYSLGNLIRHFGISVANRHRALDDTLATVDILSRIVSNENGMDQIDFLINEGIRTAHLPEGLSLQRLHSLPETPGVYYFYNSYRQVIYVGKSNNIRKRVFQHFSKTDEKSGKLMSKAADISFEETGHELIAMLRESAEIKAIQPEINKAQRTREYPYFIYSYYDEQGYLCFGWQKSNVKNRLKADPVNHYGSKEGARSHLGYAVNEAALCLCKNGLFDRQSDCFYHQTGECCGADLGFESPEMYNQRAQDALELLRKKFDEDFLLILSGKSEYEKAVVLIEGGHYLGYGYLSDELQLTDMDTIRSHIKISTPNPECNRIVKTYMEKNTDYKRIIFR